MFTVFHSWGQGNKGHGYGEFLVTLYPEPVSPGPGPGATLVEEGGTLGVNAQKVGRAPWGLLGMGLLPSLGSSGGWKKALGCFCACSPHGVLGNHCGDSAPYR